VYCEPATVLGWFASAISTTGEELHSLNGRSGHSGAASRTLGFGVDAVGARSCSPNGPDVIGSLSLTASGRRNKFSPFLIKDISRKPWPQKGYPKAPDFRDLRLYEGCAGPATVSRRRKGAAHVVGQKKPASRQE
jgi:hypothetical protein